MGVGSGGGGGVGDKYIEKHIKGRYQHLLSHSLTTVFSTSFRKSIFAWALPKSKFANFCHDLM